MANTTFTGPVRSKDGFDAIITNSTTGAITNTMSMETYVATVTVADESSDTTCFPLFVDSATGNLAPKSDSQLTYNSSTGELGCTIIDGGTW